MAVEGIGTCWLVFGSCGSAVISAAYPEVGIGLLGVSLSPAISCGGVMSAEPMPPDVAENAETQEGYIVSAVLGLLALLMGFTFALAVDRVETRRMLVLEEANAIGTTYLRGQLLDDPHRSRISSMLVDYTGNRISIGRPSPEDAHKLVGARKRGAEQVLSFRRPV